MRAGDLNRRIEIQSNTPSYDSFNQPIDNWKTDATVWASITTNGGGEFYAAQKVNAETQALFKIRYRPEITSLHRIKYGDRIFEILPPINDVGEAHKEVLISAKEVK